MGNGEGGTRLRTPQPSTLVKGAARPAAGPDFSWPYCLAVPLEREQVGTAHFTTSPPAFPNTVPGVTKPMN